MHSGNAAAMPLVRNAATFSFCHASRSVRMTTAILVSNCMMTPRVIPGRANRTRVYLSSAISLSKSATADLDGANPESRDSGSGPSDHPGMKIPHRSIIFEAAMTEIDVIIIGAGHNGLTCAAYLAMAGLRVKVVERRKVVGGAAVTEEFHPGFRNSVAAYTVSLLNPQIISDLKLRDHGLRIVERRAQNFLPSPDSSYLLTVDARTQQSVAKLSERDADRLDAFTRELETIADVLRQFVLGAPPNIV